MEILGPWVPKRGKYLMNCAQALSHSLKKSAQNFTLRLVVSKRRPKYLNPAALVSGAQVHFPAYSLPLVGHPTVLQGLSFFVFLVGL